MRSIKVKKLSRRVTLYEHMPIAYSPGEKRFLVTLHDTTTLWAVVKEARNIKYWLNHLLHSIWEAWEVTEVNWR